MTGASFDVGVKVTVDATVARTEAKTAADALTDMGQRAQAAGERAASGLGAMSTAAAQTSSSTASLAQQSVIAGDKAVASANKIGVSAAQTAAAMRNVPAQFTDIVTSLQGGQSPLTVLMQQGGQLKDMFGGIGPAARALGGYVLGLVNPFTVAAAGAALLGVAYHQGSQEADAFRMSVVMSGNAAGTSVGQLTDMARAIASISGTQGAASAALAQMAASGQVARENLQGFTAVALDLDKYVGVPVKKTVEDLTALGQKPVEASVKLNEQYNYLTASVHAQIKALVDQGREEEAAALAQRTYMSALEQRKNQIVANLGTVERAWISVTGTAKAAWDAMAGVGRSQTTQQQLDEVSKKIAEATEKSAGNSSMASLYAPQLARLRDQQAALQEMQRVESRSAAATAERVRTENAAIAASTVLDNIRKRIDKTSEATKKVEEYKRAIAASEKANAPVPSEAQQAKEIAAIQKAYGAKAPSGEGAANRAERDAFDARVEAAREGYRLMHLQTADGLDAIDSLRKQDLLSEYAAVARKRDLALADLKNREQSIAAELALYKGRKDSMKERESLESDLAKVRQEQQNVGNKADRDLDEVLAAPQIALLKSTRQATEALRDQAQAMEAQNTAHGLGKSAVMDLTIAQLEQQRADLDATNNVMPGYLEALEARIAAQRRLRDATAQDESLDTKDKADKELQAEAKKSADGISNVFREGFARSFTDKSALASFGASLKTTMVTSIANSFYDATIKSAVDGFSGWLTGALKEGLSGLSSGGGSGGSSAISSLVGAVGRYFTVASAKGNVFQTPALHAYANSVVDRPTVFPFAKGVGLMGEAGPEAIVPLRRDSQGRLGIGALGGGGMQAEVHIHNNGAPANASVQQSQSANGGLRIDVMLEQIEEALADKVGSGSGPLPRAMEGRFGLRTAVS